MRRKIIATAENIGRAERDQNAERCAVRKREMRAEHDQHADESKRQRGPAEAMDLLAEEHHREQGDEHGRRERDRCYIGQRNHRDGGEQTEHAHGARQRAQRMRLYVVGLEQM